MDYSRLGDRAVELAEFDGHQAHMRMQDGHCAALSMNAASGEFSCTAYDARPQICRDLARGSAECGAERFEKAERPLLLLKTFLKNAKRLAKVPSLLPL